MQGSLVWCNVKDVCFNSQNLILDAMLLQSEAVGYVSRDRLTKLNQQGTICSTLHWSFS